MKKTLLISLLLLTKTLFAQVPANDECANATLLTASATCSSITGTIANATTSTTTTSCTGSKDVFYKFVANNTSATVNVTGSSGLDLEVATFSACGTTSISCVDATISGQTETIPMSGLIIGNTYYIKVQDYSTSGSASTYTFTICVVNTSTTIPTNDVCSNAIALNPSTTCASTTGTFMNATNSGVTNSCSGYYDVFYKFVANSTTATVTSVPGTNVDVVLSVMTSCTSTTSLACVDNTTTASSTEVANLTGLTIGNTYYIKVQNFNTTLSTTPTFTICVVSTSSTVPANDECANAISISPSATCVATNGTILNATTSNITSSCTGYYDVFYKFVAANTASTVTVVGSTGLDVKISAFSACGGTDIGCVDQGLSQGSTEVMNLTSLIVGNTYYIKVANYTSTVSSTYTFTVCVQNTTTTNTPPINDECANAISITPSAACVATNGTILNATTSTTTSSCAGYYDVFYKFVAANTASTVTVVGSTGLDVKISAFSACGGTNIGCVDQGLSQGSTEVMNLTSLIVGNTYYIKVANYTSTLSSTYTFTVCVQNGITTATQSSAALNAISLYPNPTQNVLNIENVSIDTKVELIDLTGKTIFVRDLSSDTQVDLSNYSAGVYILKLTSDGVSENRRVVLSK